MDIFLKNNGDAFLPTQTWETSEKDEKIGLCTTTIYPPQDVNLIEKMCEYLMQQKKIPLNYTCDAKNVPSDFVPTETSCYFCNVSLNTAVRISKVGRLLIMDAMVTGAQIYYKSCPNCQICYRYQEYSDGVYDFNDTFLISIEVCNFLRGCLLQHVPIGSVVKVLESKIGVCLNAQAILNAYLHFDALSEHSYEYSCILCGYHPKVLIMDLNKKIAFRCSASNLQLPQNYDEDNHDTVNADTFWRIIEIHMIKRGYGIEADNVEPFLLNWAPYIGKKTRRNKFLINTEHRKVSRHPQELEKDCREVTEERILELLSQSKASDAAKLAKTLGFKNCGSKLDAIMKIKSLISDNDEELKKTFSKLWGCSGGWLSGTCPHGVVYVIKFVLRAESPRDYVDVLLSMKFQPNICIIDMAHMVVAHGNKRKPNMFSPNDGMVSEISEENIKKVWLGTLSVSLPWLEKENASTTSVSDDVHPVTG